MRYLWLFCLSAALWGQALNLSHFQNGSASLAGTWKFHAGDDPRWADPNFDDSGWKLVQVPGRLDKQGYPNFSGYGWYRLALQLDTDIAAQDLELLFAWEYGPYEVYVNGSRVGGFGPFPPQKYFYSTRFLSFAVPKIRSLGPPRLMIAFRFFRPTRLAHLNRGGLLYGPIEIGTAAVVQNRFAAERYQRILNQLPTTIVHCLMLVSAVILIAVYSLDRRPEYLWLGLGFAARAFSVAISWLASDTFLLTYEQNELIWLLLGGFYLFVTVYGIWLLLATPTRRSTITLRLLFTLISLNVTLDLITDWVYLQGGHTPLSSALDGSIPILSAVDFAISTCVYLTIAILILRWSRNVAAQTRWLAVSFVPWFLYAALENALNLNQVLHFLPALTQWFNSNLENLLLDLVSLLTVLAFGYFLLRRFGAARAEQERLHTEMETARQVQLLMLPSQSVTIPNLRVEAVYLPAQEVGGDFFQIGQTRDGSLLMVIGDVSGKGLKAALTVSLIVGLWQDVIDGSEQSPKYVLSWLNEQLLRRFHEGFVTCLCLRLCADSTLTVANAGHLAPYTNGQEILTINGLPLGISSEIEYSETQHVLAPEDTLTVISDGVVEARDKNRKLFGFERLQQALSQRLGADTIARSAQQFGQEDDITVISISRRAVGVKPLSQTQAASMSVPSPVSG